MRHSAFGIRTAPAEARCMNPMGSRMSRVVYPLAILALDAFATPVDAAWKVDPDFRPLPTFGYAVPVPTAIQTDGKFLVGPIRYRADGSIDGAFAPEITDLKNIWVSPLGQIYAFYQTSQPYELIWLTNSGAKTATKVLLNLDVSEVFGFLSDGRFYIRGQFSTVNGVFRPQVARINPDGTLDATFDPGSGVSPTEGWLSHGVSQADGKLLLGGKFTTFAGINRKQIVRLNIDGTVDLTFDAGPEIFAPGTLATVGPHTIAVDNLGRVLRSDYGVIRRCDANGGNAAVIATATYQDSAGAIVYGLFPLPDGSLLVNGNFDHIDGVPRFLIARLNSDGSVDQAADAGLAFDDSFVVSSHFHQLPTTDYHLYIQSGSQSHNLVRLSSGLQLDPTFQLSAAPPSRARVSAIAPTPSGSIVIGGAFTEIDGSPRAGLARLNGDGTLDTGFVPSEGTAGPPHALAVDSQGRVLVGGSFFTAGGQPRTALARFNVDGSFDTTFDAHFGDGAVVHALAIQSNGSIVVGGRFSSVAGTPRANLARLLPDGTLDFSFVVTSGVTGTDAVVHSVELLTGNQLLVAGYFDAWNAARRWSLARLHPDGSLDTSFDPASNTSGMRLSGATAATDGAVIFGGETSSLAHITGRLDASGGRQFIQVPSEISRIWRVPAVAADTTTTSLVSAIPYREDAFGGPYWPYEPYAFLTRFDAAGVMDRAIGLEFGAGATLAFAHETTGALLLGGDFAQADGMAYAGLLRLVPDTPPTRLSNISTRGFVGTNDEILIAGFHVAGDEPQRVVIRGIAKHLEAFNVPNPASNTHIAVFRNGETTPVGQNDVWYTTFNNPGDGTRLARLFDRVGAFPLTLYPAARGMYYSFDSALQLDLLAGGYTVQLSAQTPGIGLVEVYDANGIGADRKLVNISTRGRVGTGDQRLIAGFVVDRGTKRVLIRAVGPGIASLIAGTLANPTIDLVRQSDQVVITTNDNWGTNANAAAIAAASLQVSGLQLANGSADAALLVDLPAGPYTVVAAGVGATTGIALVEVYEVQLGP